MKVLADKWPTCRLKAHGMAPYPLFFSHSIDSSVSIEAIITAQKLQLLQEQFRRV